MNTTAVIASIITVLSLWFGSYIFKVIKKDWDEKRAEKPVEVKTGSERHWQKVIHEIIGGNMEVRLDCGTRVDILNNEWAIEIDWSHKWAEGIGQALYYSTKTGKLPQVILLVSDSKKEQKYSDRVKFVGIYCRMFDINKGEFVD